MRLANCRNLTSPTDSFDEAKFRTTQSVPAQKPKAVSTLLCLSRTSRSVGERVIHFGQGASIDADIPPEFHLGAIPWCSGVDQRVIRGGKGQRFGQCRDVVRINNQAVASRTKPFIDTRTAAGDGKAAECHCLQSRCPDPIGNAYPDRHPGGGHACERGFM